MAQVGLAQVWPSWQARAHPKRDTGSGRQASGSRAVLPLARPSRQPSPPDSATSAPHAPDRRAGRRRRTVPLVPRATGPAHDADGTAEWHRMGLAQVWPSWQARAHPKRDTGSGRQASGSRAVLPLARPSRQPSPPDSATSAPHAPARRAGRRRTVPLVPRATRPAHDAAGTAEWHRWAWRKFGRPGKRGRTPRGTQAQGGRRLGAGPCCHSPAPAANRRRRRTVPLVSSALAGQACRSPPPDSATSATRNTASARCGWDR